MMERLPLALARKRDPMTSVLAAESVNVRAHDNAIRLALLNAKQGLIADEIAEITKLDPVQVSRRMASLERRGYVWRKIVARYIDTEHPIYESRRNARGRMANVWWSR